MNGELYTEALVSVIVVNDSHFVLVTDLIVTQNVSVLFSQCEIQGKAIKLTWQNYAIAMD